MTKKEILKLKAAMLYIINNFNGIDKLRLAKILYFANQKHIKEYGRTIINDKFIAMRHGPVPSFCLDTINHKNISEDHNIISNSIELRGIKIFSEEKYDPLYLSKSDVKILDQTLNEYIELSPGMLSNLSHDYAWKNTAGNREMSTIDIAIASGASNDMIEIGRAHV